MRKVLILGGYGTFGGRVAARVAAQGFEVLVAGRSLSRAKAFCAGRERLVPLVLDGENGLPQALEEHRPFALIDAAGPFQGSGYGTAHAAIDAGCHYLDLADATAYVTGIGALDKNATNAGVCVISGASSVPALSGAVVARLAEGMDQVTSVELVLSASSRGTSGRSVTKAILSYIGRSVRLRRGGRWTCAFGWQGIRAFDFEVEGEPPLRRRLAAVADVPDLQLLPERLPGCPGVTFYAGTDAPWHNLGLWLLSWPVRWNWLRRPERFASLLSALQRWTSGPGSLRSAFEVRLWGTAGHQRLERRWTLIASGGEGPEIPSLAVPLLLKKLEQGGIAPGARDAGGLLSLQDFRPSLTALATAQAIAERELPPPLYARVMGEAFHALPSAVRQIHQLLRDAGAAGEAEVILGRNPFARFIARLLGFPPAGTHRLYLHLSERDGRERWTRDFSGHRFASELFEKEGRLNERFGLIRFEFDLPSDRSGLRMIIRRWWLGPIPLPLRLAPRSDAREWEEAGRFQFHVPIELPLLGLLVEYRGWLVPAGSQ